MRRTRPEKYRTPGDARYNSELVQGFINRLMRRGKKSTATRIVYDAFDLIEGRAKRNALEIFESAMRNVSPMLEVKPRRVGGATYQVPVEVGSERRVSLAMRWILVAARTRGGKSMAERLAGELMDASGSTGAALKKRGEDHQNGGGEPAP